ncbi:hypothetical protein OBV_10520 [Oscillibacter valericigenes Sjm18-20]|nr:hypothetical protein OBV_10520 [Oscillibacter valericigenes Sjm18-20]
MLSICPLRAAGNETPLICGQTLPATELLPGKIRDTIIKYDNFCGGLFLDCGA